MNRSFSKHLDQWRTSRVHKPLIVRGSRQVGKTHTITEFGRNAFSSFAAFDFEEDNRLQRIFAGPLSADGLVRELEVHCGKRIIPGETLVFFDEIQACPEALKSLRYFHKQMPSLHIVAAGSMLEFALDENSFPVGSVEFGWMRPMSFAEYLEAVGEELLLEQRPDRLSTEPLPESIHQRFLQQLQNYFVVGGMPEAVAEYCASGSLTNVTEVHRALVHSYVADLNKQRRRMDIDGVAELLERIPAQTGRHVKYAHLEPEWNAAKTRKVLDLLERILLIHRVRSCSAQALPLGASASDKIFKLLFLDIGLMRHQCGLPAAEVLHSPDLLDVFRGAVAEQFVGQELLCAEPSDNERMYYWERENKNSLAEVDYLIVREGKIVPVEVKSGTAGKLKSLSIFQQEHPQSPMAYVLSCANVRWDPVHRIAFLPLYARL